MPDDTKKNGDIRINKTDKAMYSALVSLLRKHSFKKIAVKDICEESLISRATFYTRFADKYSFLKWWIGAAWSKNIVSKDDTYEIKAQKINIFIDQNKQIIRNLFYEADNWTLDALFEALCSILYKPSNTTDDDLWTPQYIVLTNFYIGGMIQYIMWQVKNGFPQDIATMNVYLYQIINIFMDCV